ncbi:RES domain-containing protein [Chitinophaga barathri]|uniref:RES domain-containing protein n=1 Tax=Chitinophaga barathri TaxID=1647451 RepID=A0A3N4MTU7_9BACT|nr:RES domain-containing protein [Chitinophaga barathri]RPD42969.1 RES domain-containing protein [Chitinophaga barathri]
MKLFRLVHENVTPLLEKNPVYGCSLHTGRPFFYGFEGIAGAILESSIYFSLYEVPPTIVSVEYDLPDESLHTIKDNSPDLYGNYARGNDRLGAWVADFLHNNVALVAAFPSKHWARQRNYIINPKHDLFQQVKISDIRSVYY